MKENELTVERKEPGHRGQYYVTVRDRREWTELLDILDGLHFNGVGKVTRWKRPKIPALVVDKNRWEYFLTNITCLACGVSCGHFAVSFEEFLESVNKGDLSIGKVKN